MFPQQKQQVQMHQKLALLQKWNTYSFIVVDIESELFKQQLTIKRAKNVKKSNVYSRRHQ